MIENEGELEGEEPRTIPVNDAEEWNLLYWKDTSVLFMKWIFTWKFL